MVNRGLIIGAIIIFVIVLVAVVSLSPKGNIQLTGFMGCEEQSLETPCNDVSECVSIYEDMGAPQDWLNNQVFTCRDFNCFITPSECDTSLVTDT